VCFLKKPNKFISIGLVIVAIMQLLKHFSVQLTDSIEGLGFGIGIAFELIGIYFMNHDISKLKNYKMNLLKKCFNK